MRNREILQSQLIYTPLKSQAFACQVSCCFNTRIRTKEGLEGSAVNACVFLCKKTKSITSSIQREGGGVMMLCCLMQLTGQSCLFI